MDAYPYFLQASLTTIGQASARARARPSGENPVAGLVVSVMKEVGLPLWAWAMTCFFRSS
jgi:hypothetical protein